MKRMVGKMVLVNARSRAEHRSDIPLLKIRECCGLDMVRKSVIRW